MASEASGGRDRKRHGRHYTPPALARFLARRLLAHIPVSDPRRADALRVLDPACGDGELLLAVCAEAAARLPRLRLELLGCDLDPAAVEVARDRADQAGIEIDWHTGDFLLDSADLADGSFDAIITNPPYVRTQQLGGATAQLLAKRFGLRGRIDLTHPFVATIPRLLEPGGVLGLLCANRFLTTKAGANIRRLLLTELAPVELYDLGDTKLFEAAVLPAVTIATRGEVTRACRYVSAYEIPPTGIACAADLFEALVAESSSVVAHNGRVFAVEVGLLATGELGRMSAAATTDLSPAQSCSQSGDGNPPATSDSSESHDNAGAAGASGGFAVPGSAAAEPTGGAEAVDSAELSDEVSAAAVSGRELVRPGDVLRPAVVRVGGEGAWRMSRPEVDAWLGRIGARTWRTFGEVGRIRVGIKTTADRVFISDRWGERVPRPEADLLLALITHDDVAAWRVRRAGDTRVLYPYDTARPVRTPIDLAEFPCAAEYLRTHKDTLAARGYVIAGGREWFEIWVPQRPHLWRTPKVVFPDISDRPRFALDRSGAVVNGDCYWISLTDLAQAGDAERLAYLLMGVANSALGLRFYDAVCGNRLYSGRRRWITQYVSRLPLPDPAASSAAEIIALARDLADGSAAPDPAALGELDERVSAAFGLR
ncbi:MULTISPECIES: Eco57I restriction-modification methylase domain-containing protein [unclassified Nocardia]|uniref:Eco57I restriction-modification methylase domain-containing protein n=1 Tax=unclassified Nocardia TaxID=2637762 RepID=UPI001CE3E6A9|nr:MULTISPECIES: N-6 DNA methylase [unclassified Nocardia]